MESGAVSGRGARQRARFEREESELEFARIVAFSDGVFAIAMTLLVLALHIPEGVSDLTREMKDQVPDFLAFLLSFAVLAQIWFFHHRFFGSLARFDAALIALNFAYLALVALVPFTSELIGDYGGESGAVIVYAANIAGLGLVGAVMVRYALDRELGRSDGAGPFAVGGGRERLVAAVFLISIPIALLSAHAAEASWLVLFVIGALGARHVRRRGRTA